MNMSSGLRVTSHNDGLSWICRCQIPVGTCQADLDLHRTMTVYRGYDICGQQSMDNGNLAFYLRTLQAQKRQIRDKL